MPDRIPSLYEQALKTTAAGLNDEVLATLGAATSSSVAAQIAPIEANVTAISGVNTNQAAQITAISGSTLSLTSSVASLQLSASAAFVDINNLDLSLTQSISTLFDTSGSAALTDGGVVAVPTSAAGWISLVTINGTIKIPFYV